jgi:hypothetical protein
MEQRTGKIRRGYKWRISISHTYIEKRKTWASTASFSRTVKEE